MAWLHPKLMVMTLCEARTKSISDDIPAPYNAVYGEIRAIAYDLGQK